MIDDQTLLLPRHNRIKFPGCIFVTAFNLPTETQIPARAFCANFAKNIANLRKTSYILRKNCEECATFIN